MTSVDPLLIPVKKDIETIRQTVLTNVVKMLHKRGWISNSNVSDQIKNMINSQNDDQLYKINLSTDLTKVKTYYPEDEKDGDGERKNIDKEFNGKYVMVKLLPLNITSVGKSPLISEFLLGHSKCHKIMIVDAITEKVKNAILHNNKHLEFFEEEDMMHDLLGHNLSPQYEVLTPEDVKELLVSYNTTKRNLQYILDTDPAALYLFLEKGQVVRIKRNSESTGSAIVYKIAVHRKS